jgi:hypothetical protein
MRAFSLLGFAFLGIACAGTVTEAPSRPKTEKRYGVEPDLAHYPQGTPQETLQSVLTAVEQKQVKYLLAQLADPEFVDRRVAAYGGNVEQLVQESEAKLKPDSPLVKQLRQFAKDGEWKIDGGAASARLKDVTDRAVNLRKLGERWFFESGWKKME